MNPNNMILKLKSFGTIIFLLVFSMVPACAQSIPFTVLKVTGNVFNLRLNKDLQNGDKVVSDDKLRFSSEGAYVVLLNAQAGRKVVRDVPQNTTTELKSLLTDIVSLEKKHTMSRGVGEDSPQAVSLKTIKSELNVDTLLVLGTGKALLSKDLMTETANVTSRYMTGDRSLEKPVNKGPILDMSKNSLLGDLSIRKIQLIYYPSANSTIFSDDPPEALGIFVPRYLSNESSLQQEVQIILKTYEGYKTQVLLEEIGQYIEDEYGPVLQENLVYWLNEKNLLKS